LIKIFICKVRNLLLLQKINPKKLPLPATPILGLPESVLDLLQEALAQWHGIWRRNRQTGNLASRMFVSNKNGQDGGDHLDRGHPDVGDFV
jgi:hypothetical protein